MTPLFIILNDAPKSYGANKKNRINLKIFLTKIWIFENWIFSVIFGGAHNWVPQINFGDDVTWALLSKSDCFRGSYLHIEIDLNQKVLTLRKNLLDLF